MCCRRPPEPKGFRWHGDPGLTAYAERVLAASTAESLWRLVDVLEQDPAIEAAALGSLASRLELDVLQRHIVRLRLGMLDEERPDDTRRVYYVPTGSPLWKIIEAAAEVIER